MERENHNFHVYTWKKLAEVVLLEEGPGDPSCHQTLQRDLEAEESSCHHPPTFWSRPSTHWRRDESQGLLQHATHSSTPLTHKSRSPPAANSTEGPGGRRKQLPSSATILVSPLHSMGERERRERGEERTEPWNHTHQERERLPHNHWKKTVWEHIQQQRNVYDTTRVSGNYL